MRHGTLALLRPILLLALIGAVPNAAAAQERLPLTVKGGLVASDFVAVGGGGTLGGAGATANSFGAASFGIGIATRFDLPGRFALQLELAWLRKAADVTLAREPAPGLGFFFSTARARTDYLEVPLLVRYELPVGRTRPYLLAGPAVAFNLSSKLTGPGFQRLVDVGAVSPDLADRMRSTDVVLSLGAGVEFSADSPRGWAFELRGAWGLLHLLPENIDNGARTKIDARTRAFLAMVGYRF